MLLHGLFSSCINRGLFSSGGAQVSHLDGFSCCGAQEDDTTLMAESEEELKSLLMKEKEESEKVGLKLNIQKAKIMASGPITSWQIDRERMETVTDLFSWAPKLLQTMTAAIKLKDAYSLEGKL